MLEVIERLRATDREDTREQRCTSGPKLAPFDLLRLRHTAGCKAGDWWAKRHATAKELRLLDTMPHKEFGAVLDDSGNDTGWSMAERLARAVLPQDEFNRQTAAEWLLRAGIERDQWNDAVFLGAFVRSACILWGSVREDI